MSYHVVTADGKVLFSGSFPKAMAYKDNATRLYGRDYVHVMNSRDMMTYTSKGK